MRRLFPALIGMFLPDGDVYELFAFEALSLSLVPETSNTRNTLYFPNALPRWKTLVEFGCLVWYRYTASITALGALEDRPSCPIVTYTPLKRNLIGISGCTTCRGCWLMYP